MPPTPGNGPLYPAARSTASRLHEHFARHAEATLLPDERAIAGLIDAAFWASLQREEGYAPEISLAYLPPERARRPLLFAEPLRLAARSLAKLGPAVERPGIHLGVWRARDGLSVWGTTRDVPSFCLVVEVLRPGLLVVKHRIREDSAKFRNVAVFEGDDVKILSHTATEACERHPLLRSLLGTEPWDTTDDGSDVLLRLAVSMRAHRRGGTLLVVPASSATWRDSIVRPIAYAVQPPFAELGELALAASNGSSLAVLERVIEAVAGLTAVDGATLMTDRYELLAFGVKIGRPDGRPRVERVRVSEPVEDAVATSMAPVELGGTRHISAAQFAQDQQDAVSLVASQDGRFTIFAWSGRDALVHAYRVESLLL
jgi:hypothetical protein